MPADFESRFDIDYNGELPESVDEAALKRMETVAYVLDESVRVPGIGFRIGIDPVLGALPVAGDVVSGAFSLYIVAESSYLGVSFTTLVEMLANITIDVVGEPSPTPVLLSTRSGRRTSATSRSHWRISPKQLRRTAPVIGQATASIFPSKLTSESDCGTATLTSPAD
jgi:hypothetical protein